MEFLTDETKEKLNKLMEDGLEFIDIPNEILCSNCNAVTLFHYVYPCSHPYCRDCYVDVFQKNKKNCRICKTEIGTKMIQRKDIEFVIYKLKVVCPNKILGCEDIIELSELLEHLENCKFSKERQLPKLYKENKDELADFDSLKSCVKKMTTSIKKLTEKSEQDNNQKLFSDVRKLADLVEILTSDNQKLTADVKSLTFSNESKDRKIAHLSKQIDKIESESKEMVSKITKQFATGDQQENDAAKTVDKTLSERLDVVNNNVETLARRMDKFEKWFKVTEKKSLTKLQPSKLSEEEIEFLIEDLRQRQSSGPMLWIIENYSKKFKENAAVSSQPFYSAECGHIMILDLQFGANNLTGTIKFFTGNKEEIRLTCFYYRATISIVDQSNRAEKRDWTRVFEPHFGTTAEEWIKKEHEFVIADFSVLERKESQKIYVKDDTIKIKILVEPLTRLFGNIFSTNGMLLCTIDNFARTKRESQQWINHYFYSDYFRSSEGGYRMQARWFWGSDINFHVIFLVGEDDADLPSFYSHKCTVFIVNQKDDSGKKDLTVGTITLDAAAIGEETVKKRMMADSCHWVNISQSQYEKYPFLLRDRLIFKVIIEKV